MMRTGDAVWGERSREGTQVLSGPACHLLAVLGTLLDLGFSKNRCQESGTRGHLGGEPRKHLQGGDSAKGKDGTQPWWPLHLTLGLRAVVQADTREALAGRVRCHINLSQLVNWSVTSQASEATGPGASVTSNCFLPMGPRWLTLSLVRLTASIPSGVPSGAHSALSLSYIEKARGVWRDGAISNAHRT